MSRLLSHLLLLLYAGVYLHCQPLRARAEGLVGAAVNRQEQRRGRLCQKKLQTVQVAPQAAHAPEIEAKLLPLDWCLGGDFAALYFGLLFSAHQPTLIPARGPNAGPAQVFANHPNKAPPVRFS